MKTRALAALVAVALAGCTVGPDYVRPGVDTPAAWRIDYPKAADVANTRWWEQFGDPVLNDLIDTALRENRDIRIAAARVDQFIGALDSTRSQLFPQIGYGADASRARASQVGQPPLPPGADPYFNLYQGSLGASWQLDLFGRVRRLSEAAQAQVYASEQAQRGVVLSVVTQRRDELHRPARARPAAGDRAGDGGELRRDRAHLRPALQGRHRVADRSGADPLAVPAGAGRDSRVPAADRRAGEPDLDPARTQSRADPARQDHRPAGRAADSRRTCPSALLQRRPDILQAEQNLVAANANIGATRALYYPTISLTGAARSASTAFGNFLTGPASAWLVGAGLAGPIFTFGAIEGPGAHGGGAAAAGGSSSTSGRSWTRSARPTTR